MDQRPTTKRSAAAPTGRFITFEGGEGAGKSTQVKRLAERLRAAGAEVVTTREPGGSPGAEEIRDLLVHGEAARWDPVTETLLHFAARRDHLTKTVWPALERQAWVVCDRFADSTRAYQGAGQGGDAVLIEDLYRQVVGAFAPCMTFILDLPVETGLARAAARNEGGERYEGMDRTFHERLRQGFLEIARREPQRCRVIDATAAEDAVAAAVWSALAEHRQAVS
ncbi:dTMP kinase [Algihabitans albus]|uniref:dTMP kinase n=1 Tax=Algihabitans albus TaxID=2164067 RepID=UPI000E5CC4C0|nr:dTMP kinase [Algihabitans albus]